MWSLLFDRPGITTNKNLAGQRPFLETLEDRCSPSSIIDLGTLGGAASYAYGINNLGQVVGSAQTSWGIYHAFVYSDGAMVDLNDRLPDKSDWLVLTQARSINDNGQVVGSGVTSDGFTHAFLFNINNS